MGVRRRQCKTCPFREGGDHRLRERIKGTVLTEASQLCHSEGPQGRPNTLLCRGARDWQLMILHRMGFLAAPTDAAWAARVKSTLRRRK